MSTIRANNFLDGSGGNTATINGITPALATQAQAEAGTDNTTLMTPLRERQALAAGLNATGAAPLYACRAWVNFNGSGTVAIRASGNVTSITDGGVGIYTINFATSMSDVNYCVVGSCCVDTFPSTAQSVNVQSGQTVSSVTIRTAREGSVLVDAERVNVAIFR